MHAHKSKKLFLTKLSNHFKIIDVWIITVSWHYSQHKFSIEKKKKKETRNNKSKINYLNSYWKHNWKHNCIIEKVFFWNFSKKTIKKKRK